MCYNTYRLYPWPAGYNSPFTPPTEKDGFAPVRRRLIWEVHLHYAAQALHVRGRSSRLVTCPDPILTRLVMQHHDKPSSRNRTLRDLVRILLATVTPPVHALPMGSIPFTLGAGALQVEPVWWSSTERIGAVRFVFTCTVHYEIIRTSSSWIDPER